MNLDFSFNFKNSFTPIPQLFFFNFVKSKIQEYLHSTIWVLLAV